MSLPPFQYLAPKSTEELLGMLATHRDKARVLAGGTDLINWMAEKIFCPDYVIDVNGLPNIGVISYESGKGLTIGAAAKIEAIEKSEIVKEKYFSLHAAAAQIGSPQVRAMASIGGNCCNASPCADMPPPLVTLGTTVALLSSRGRREMLLEDFILGNRETAIEPDELLESFFVPEPWPRSASRYATMGLREAQEIDIASVAVNVGLGPTGDAISDVRISMGAVAPIAVRAPKAEEMLKGRKPSDEVLDRVAESCGEECSPIDDLRASASYRRYVIKVLAGRTLREALAAIG
jgi:carbon-monoxide dehydrogenase medium subunit